MSETISLSHSDYLELAAAYEQAVLQKKDKFTWREHEFVTAYAKYLLEYITNKINENGQLN